MNGRLKRCECCANLGCIGILKLVYAPSFTSAAKAGFSVSFTADLKVCSTLTRMQQLWKRSIRRFSGGHALLIFPSILAFKKNHQVLSQMNGVVGQLFQTARSKDQVEVLLIGNMLSGTAQAT